MLSAYSTPTPYRRSACLSDRSCLQFLPPPGRDLDLRRRDRDRVLDGELLKELVDRLWF